MMRGIDGFAQAASAYTRVARGGDAAETTTVAQGDKGGFADMVRQAVDGVVDSQKATERQAAAGVEGKGDLSGVVAAVAEAEVSLQAVVAVRDRVIEAYKDIMRMPI
ncbi:MAG: flagellar hook-basal body complex protein FliE [Rhodospirillales bacterium]